MPKKVKQIAFGPVPSRRLGQSLGINNIPPKICTYSCIYCQLGRTLKINTERIEKDVREDLCKANWVSVKIDAMDYKIWGKVDRPHRSFKLYKILDGISKFAREFSGDLITESMLIRNINDSSEEIKKLADFIHGLNPKMSYLAIPTRPPAEKWAKPATEENLNNAYQIFKERNVPVEYLIGYEGNAFAFTGNVEEDLLSITSVHPMRTEGVDEYLKKAKANWSNIERLIRENKLVEVEYDKNKFYLRKSAG